MRRTRPPFVASWILDRFGSAPETEAIAGDLLEQYQQGRSRWWYWREVIVAVVRGAWSGVQQHVLLLLLAIAAACIVNFAWQWLVTPFEYSLIVRYVLGRQAGPQDIPLVSFLIEGPFLMATGWTAARCGRECRVPAVFSVAGIYLSIAAWSTWKYQNGWPESFGYHFSVWNLWPIPVGMILLLLGGGLLTGPPKRSLQK